MKEKQKPSISETPIKSFVSNLLSSQTILVLTILTGVVINRGLGPELKGSYTSLRLIPTLFAPLLALNYYGGILYYSLKGVLDASKFWLTGFLLMAFIGILSSGVIYYLSSLGVFGNIISSADSTSLGIIVISTPFVILNAYMERIFNSYKLFRPSNIRNVISTIFILLSFGLLWWVGELTLISALAIITTSIFLNFILNLLFTRRLFHFERKIYWEKILLPWRYGLKGSINQLVTKSNDKFDQVILGFLISPANFGIYTVGVAVCGLISGVPSSYTTVFFTQVATRNEMDGLELYKRAMRITIYLTLLLGLVFILIAKYAIVFLYGSAYSGATIVVYFYMPGIIFQIASRISLKFYAAKGKPLKNSIVYSLALVVSAPFYFLLIPKYGIAGAAVSSTIGYFVAFAASLLQLKRDYPFKFSEVLLPTVADFNDLKYRVTGIIRRRKNK